jgi:hypothetical protein
MDLLENIILSGAKKVNSRGINGGKPGIEAAVCAAGTKRKAHLGGGSDDRRDGNCYHCGKEGVPSR